MVAARNQFKNDLNLSNKEELNKRIAKNINRIHKDQRKCSEKLADIISFGAGTWTFIIVFIIGMGIWMTINIIWKSFDPFPFILLNLCLSTVAALQAPVILMSQRRADHKDRVRDELSYRIDAKNEVLIEEILKRLDRLEHTCQINKELIEHRGE
jgi:uncharacterized membrane protein